ncbi:hypothetical protein [Xylophilus sp. GOD-11R]|uniref:hypothetical protein n=1 Tax=Xylophilus sp. GOD-11R TaxID=3089814 RepID=UPI00298C595A|nr:hypothetical protein [Xylophilus sp. GOD-11R]WPB58273.1 hypothetical protein R9X41_06425 [Xylophilus sp. GOD-11R]
MSMKKIFRSSLAAALAATGLTAGARTAAPTYPDRPIAGAHRRRPHHAAVMPAFRHQERD